MHRNKSETLSIRTTAEIKDLVRQAAELERRSVASMVEILVLAYAEQHALKPALEPATTKTIRVQGGEKSTIKPKRGRKGITV